MPNSRNKVEDSSVKGKAVRPKRKKFFPLVAGNTKNSHERILGKLESRGAERVDRGRCQVLLLFCPIVSRFEADIASALNRVKADESPKVILVAMHHTFSPDHVVPPKTQHRHEGVDVPLVHCLFHETMGLLRCPRNKNAVTTLRQQMGLKEHCNPFFCTSFN
ncbi:unnamed protein product [Knipowitschia caucasica]